MAAWTQQLQSSSLTASRLGLMRGGFACPASCALAPAIPTAGPPILLRPSVARRLWYGNINPLAIDYGFRPCLRTRLTPGRLPLPGKPWVYGERVSHPFYRYLCQHNHFSEVQGRFHFPFSPQRTLPYCMITFYVPRCHEACCRNLLANGRLRTATTGSVTPRNIVSPHPKLRHHT